MFSGFTNCFKLFLRFGVNSTETSKNCSYLVLSFLHLLHLRVLLSVPTKVWAIILIFPGISWLKVVIKNLKNSAKSC